MGLFRHYRREIWRVAVLFFFAFCCLRYWSSGGPNVAAGTQVLAVGKHARGTESEEEQLRCFLLPSSTPVVVAYEASEQVAAWSTFRPRHTSPIPDHYSNAPPFPITDEDTERIDRATESPVGSPNDLMHKANPPGSNAIAGLAAYPENMETWVRVVGIWPETGWA